MATSDAGRSTHGLTPDCRRGTPADRSSGDAQLAIAFGTKLVPNAAAPRMVIAEILNILLMGPPIPQT
jgi:hypothetical protein